MMCTLPTKRFIRIALPALIVLAATCSTTALRAQGFVFTTVAGAAGNVGSADGTGSAARFNNPSGAALDGAGNLYVVEYSNHTIRKVTGAGVVTTVAGVAGNQGTVDGPVSVARFSGPAGVAVDSAGNLYVADNLSHAIRKITTGGVVTTLAGTAGSTGMSDGTGSVARFNSPNGVAVDNAGNVYVADQNNHTVRKITSGGVVTTLAGVGGISGSIDGTGSGARFNVPAGVALDSAGNVYIADNRNHTIRKITSSGVVTTLAGAAGVSGSLDGSGSAARFSNPNGVAVDSAGNVYVSDYANEAIRKISPGGVVTTLGGTPGTKGSTDGTGSAARFNGPADVAVDGTGYLYVVEFLNHTVRRGGPPATIPVISAQVTSQTVTAGGNATFAVTATGFPAPSYQWRRDGVALAGATTSALTLNGVTPGNAGSYTVVITNSAGAVTSAAALLTVNPASVLSNLSVRTTMASGQILFVGAVVSGGAKAILVRAAGPALNNFGLTGMVDPRLELYTTGPAPTATNDDWPAALAATFSSVGAFPFESGSKDAALSQALNGSFTVQAKGTGPGTILVEAYDSAGGVSPRLVNLSARNQVGTGSDILIAGFTLAGTGTKQVLIRAVGPGLAAFGVPGTLVDPRLQVFSGSNAIATNDNWEAALATTFVQVGAFALPPASKDAALLVTLNAGASYTVQVSGADGGTGEALIEVYEVF